MAVNGGHAGTKKGPNWGHVIFTVFDQNRAKMVENEQKLGVQETVLLVNHALARGKPAIFVIFVVSRASSSKALVLLARIQIRHFRHFRQKPPFSSGGTKARFTKSTVFGTPKNGQKSTPKSTLKSAV